MPKDKIGDVKVMNNEYDNEKFFEEYAKMSRSKEGLKAAGEWHQLKPLFPSLEGKSVLDLGCGYGWHCKFAEEQGATKILGIDLSKKMIEEAQKRNSGNQIEYRISGLEEYDYPENEWDCVISNLALHYIEDIVEIFQKVYRTLKPGGIFLFNIEHPVFTAGVGQDWIYTDDGKPQYWAIDNYFITGERNTHFLGCDVVKQHHTLTQIIMGFQFISYRRIIDPLRLKAFMKFNNRSAKIFLVFTKWGPLIVYAIKNIELFINCINRCEKPVFAADFHETYRNLPNIKISVLISPI